MGPTIHPLKPSPEYKTGPRSLAPPVVAIPPLQLSFPHTHAQRCVAIAIILLASVPLPFLPSPPSFFSREAPAPTIRLPAPDADGEPLLLLPPPPEEEEKGHRGQREEEEEQRAGRLGLLCHMPLWGSAASAPPAAEGGDAARAPSGSGGGSGGGGVKVIRSLLPTRRRLRLDPPAKLYFPCEQAIRARGSVNLLLLLVYCCFLPTSISVNFLTEKTAPFNRFRLCLCSDSACVRLPLRLQFLFRLRCLINASPFVLLAQFFCFCNSPLSLSACSVKSVCSFSTSVGQDFYSSSKGIFFLS